MFGVLGLEPRVLRLFLRLQPLGFGALRFGTLRFDAPLDALGFEQRRFATRRFRRLGLGAFRLEPSSLAIVDGGIRECFQDQVVGIHLRRGRFGNGLLHRQVAGHVGERAQVERGEVGLLDFPCFQARRVQRFRLRLDRSGIDRSGLERLHREHGLLCLGQAVSQRAHAGSERREQGHAR